MQLPGIPSRTLSARHRRYSGRLVGDEYPRAPVLRSPTTTIIPYANHTDESTTLHCLDGVTMGKSAGNANITDQVDPRRAIFLRVKGFGFALSRFGGNNSNIISEGMDFAKEKPMICLTQNRGATTFDLVQFPQTGLLIEKRPGLPLPGLFLCTHRIDIVEKPR